MPLRLSLVMISLLLWMMSGLSAVAQSQPVTVFAAASLKTALDEITQLYSSQTGTTVQVSYAASSALARQIQYGAPADIFVSANSGWMDWLQQNGLLRDETRVDLLSNKLVLIAAPENSVQLKVAKGFDLAAALDQSWLAMALTNAVPAGIYGKAALQSLGVWDDVKTQVAQSDNVRGALILVATAEAALGIVYVSDAVADPRVRIVDVFPPDSHPEILYPAAMIQDSTNPDATAFLSFLNGLAARQVFDENGFGLPGVAP
ncbi:MAG: molybdate transport system substrate-binding protein [Paracoccaceae bacterium]|jgi:molybdate transport system substrate-binding protein